MANTELLRQGLGHRLLARIAIDANGCWNWQGNTDPKGYGFISARYVQPNRDIRTHRLSYLVFQGPIADGLVIDHLCRNKACCNPTHLEAVTVQTNTLRGESVAAKYATRTHCGQGHAWTEENTGRREDGSRRCVACRRSQQAATYRRRKERLAAREAAV